MNSNAEEDILMRTLFKITKKATLTISSDNLLPNKLKRQYERQYNLFMNF